MRDQLHVCQDAESLAVHTRDWLVRLIKQHARESQRPFHLALSGGSTPKRLYQLLAELPAGTLDWQRIVLLWGDERNVPADDAASNFRMVKEQLLDHVAIPDDQVLAVPQPGESAEAAAAAYQQLLKTHFNTSADFPQIDCVLLGLGDDVHTASLFPGTSGLNNTRDWFVANHVPQLDCWRLTLTAPAINAARNVAFLLSGAGKQDALAKLWHAPLAPEKYPAQLIHPSQGRLWFLLDKAALGNNPLPENLMAQII